MWKLLKSLSTDLCKNKMNELTWMVIFMKVLMHYTLIYNNQQRKLMFMNILYSFDLCNSKNKKNTTASSFKLEQIDWLQLAMTTFHITRRNGLVGYDDGFTHRRSRVRFPVLVLFFLAHHFFQTRTNVSFRLHHSVNLICSQLTSFMINVTC